VSLRRWTKEYEWFSLFDDGTDMGDNLDSYSLAAGRSGGSRVNFLSFCISSSTISACSRFIWQVTANKYPGSLLFYSSGVVPFLFEFYLFLYSQ
jgi:hypothetical protein